jgi:hypothetical protein
MSNDRININFKLIAEQEEEVACYFAGRLKLVVTHLFVKDIWTDAVENLTSHHITT